LVPLARLVLGAVGALAVDPAGEVLAVEERREAWLGACAAGAEAVSMAAAVPTIAAAINTKVRSVNIGDSSRGIIAAFAGNR
jgi:chemotaxis methyl-accepting protein methylase